MSQEDVLNFLKEKKTRWISAESIRKSLGLSKSSIALNMFKLRQSGFVTFKIMLSNVSGTKLYLYKHKG